MKIQSLASALSLASVVLFSANAFAGTAYAEINWAQAHYSFDSALRVQGLDGYSHTTGSTLNAASDSQSSSDPFQQLSSYLDDGQGSYTFAGSGSFGTPSSRAFANVQRGSAGSNDYSAGTLKVEGEGWFQVTVPYRASAAIYSEGVENTVAGAMLYVVDQADSMKSFYQNSVVGDQGISDFTSGVFNVSFYNEGGLHYYDFNAYAFANSSLTAPVPEPETYALMGLGLVAVMTAKRRKRASLR